MTVALDTFRRKPTKVLAYQLTQEVMDSMAGPVSQMTLPPGLNIRPFGMPPPGEESAPLRFYVVTIHGQKTDVVLNDWIVQEPDHTHYYPIKSDIFKATYNPVNDTQMHFEFTLHTDIGFEPTVSAETIIKGVSAGAIQDWIEWLKIMRREKGIIEPKN